jgi:hypothetical protein
MKWEILIPLQIFGYVLVSFGTLIFNEFLVLPCHIMSENTKEKIK